MRPTAPVIQANQTVQSKPWKKPPGGNRGLTQAYQFRDIAADQALELKDFPATELDEKLARAKALQALNAVWSDSCDRIRILRGKPLPGSLRPQSKPTKKKQISSAPSEQPSSTDANQP